MKNTKALLVSLLVVAGLVAGLALSGHLLASSDAGAQTNPTEAKYLAALARVGPIDTHAHVFQDSPAFYAMLKRLNMRIVNICVVDQHDEPSMRSVGPQFQMDMTVHRHSQGRAAVCTTFDPYKFQDANFAQQAIRQLNESFREGAVAVKIWKNIGMELKWPSGKYVMPDDPVFEPIYKDIAAHNKTMIAHLAEPDTCWESFAEMGPQNPDYNYYKHNPYWHMYGKPGAPSKVEILAARDHILAENPHLRVIGAHLGSMEVNVDDIAQRLDRYPNFAVDTAARVHYLMAQPSEKVRTFIIKYQDRIVYGTDEAIGPATDAAPRIKAWEARNAVDWKYFATDATFEYDGLKVHGLKLPPEVLHKLYHENAVRWIPGVLSSAR